MNEQHRGLDHIRNIPREAWKKKEWPIGVPEPEAVQEKIFPEERTSPIFRRLDHMESETPELQTSAKEKQIRYPDGPNIQMNGEQ